MSHWDLGVVSIIPPIELNLLICTRVTCDISRPVASKVLNPLTRFLVAIAKWTPMNFF